MKAMASLAELMVKVGADIKDFSKGMSKVQTTMDNAGKKVSRTMEGTSNNVQKSTGVMSNSLKGLGGVIVGAFAVGTVLSFGRTMVETTADIQALESQYSQVMGGMKASTDKYLDQMGAEWNKHPNELKSAYTQYVAILKGKGVAEKDAHNLAKDMLDRTVDANAFANEDMAATTDRFMAMVKGEYDSLDTAMVNLSATMLNDKAQEVYGKKFEDLSVTQQEQLKVQEAIRQHTSAGVFGQGVREADSYQNNLANLKNTWGELMATMGSPVLEVVNVALKSMTSALKSIDFEAIKESFTGLYSKFNEGSGVLTTWNQIFQTIKPLVMEAIGTVVSFVKSKLDLLKKFWDKNGEQILQAVGNMWKGIKAVFDFFLPAILYVVKFVWESIKGVIDGALNIIMGLIKVFAGLFTGDFSKMWEGVKQLFKGAIQFVWNLMNLSFVGGIKKLIASLVKKGISLIRGLWDDVALRFMYGKDKALSLVSSLKTNVTSKFNALKDKVGSIFNKVKDFITKPIDKAKETVLGIIDKIKSAFNNLKIKIPKPKIPSVSIGKKKDAFFGFDVPSFKINWNAKGGIFNGASLLGGGQGVGEAGAEAVLPIQHKRYMKPFAGAVAAHLPQNESNGDVNQHFHFAQGSFVVREEADIDRIARALLDKQKRTNRRG
jgi:phage-related protein